MSCYWGIRRETVGDLAHFGISTQPRLLERFDRLIAAKGEWNCSEVMRDRMRARLVDAAVAHGQAPLTIDPGLP